MAGVDDGTRNRRGSDYRGPKRVDARLYKLIALSTVFGIGHHLDHVVRGNHVGWPLIPEVTPFTYTLTIYPLLAIGLYLTLTERVGPAYWTVLLGAITLVVTATHFGPWAVEPPQDVVSPYENAYVGYAAFAWLIGFVASLAVTTAYSVRRWRWARSASAAGERPSAGDS